MSPFFRPLVALGPKEIRRCAASLTRILARFLSCPATSRFRICRLTNVQVGIVLSQQEMDRRVALAETSNPLRVGRRENKTTLPDPS